MRLVFAIITFVAAAVLLAFGIGVRTAPEPTPRYDYSVESTESAPLAVIDGTTLNALGGRQTLKISGDGPIVAAYARQADVMAWVGDASYNEIAFRDADGSACTPDPADPGVCNLESIAHPGTEASVPNPYGADLWLEDFQDQDTLRMTETLPADLTFVIASDGTLPAPSGFDLVWPTPPPVSRDISAWLIIGGAVLGVIGLVLLLTAIHRMRTKGGPRRRMPKVPKRRTIKTVRSPKAATRVGAGLAILAAVSLGFAHAPQSASAEETPTPTPTSDAPGEGAAIPAVDERQVRRIVDRVISTVSSADSTNDGALVADRMTGPALELKLADYALRSKDGAQQPSSPEIPTDGELALSLPQQVPAEEATWPRSLFVVVAEQQALEGGETDAPVPGATAPAPDATAAPAPAVLPPVAMILTQDDPRSSYKVVYLVALQADIPEVPATEDGTALLSATSPLVAFPPESVNPSYVDILVNDSASASYGDFDMANDRFVLGWGLAKQQEQQAQQAAQESPNNMTFSTTIGNGPFIALATTEGGAIVAGTVRQTADVTPAEAGAKVIAQGDIHLLSGVERSERGYTSMYAGQLLFYVPPLDSDASIVVLGYSGGIISSAERPMSDPVAGANLRGAVDLSGLVRRANAPETPADPTGIVFAADDLSFGRVVEISQTVPVIIEFVDDRTPETGVEAAVRAREGRLLLARVDALASPQLVQAFQVQQLPLVAAVIAGRPLPLFAGILPPAELNDVLDQVIAVATQQGVAGAAAPGEPGAEAAPPPLPPLHQAAFEAIEAGDYPAAITAYETAIAQNPRDADAVAGLAQVRLLARLSGSEADDADRAFASGDVDAAFDFLLTAFAAADQAERDTIRARLLEYFEVLGPEDPRVAAARRRLTNLLY